MQGKNFAPDFLERKKPISVCTKISKGLTNYWSQISQQQSGSTNLDGLV